jgi:hypothetical protein
MNTEFSDIRIAGLSVERTQPSTPGTDLRHMYLALSSFPPAEWSQFFADERRFARHSMRRRAWVEGAHIVVDCVPEQIERHLGDLKVDVANANRRYRDLVKEQRAIDAQQVKDEQAEMERLNALKAKLRFD